MKIPIINRLFEKRQYTLDDERLARRLNIFDSSAGVNVNPNTALRSTAVFACVRVLSFSLASLPLVVYERLERGKKRANNNPAYKLLHAEPNPEMSSFQWRSTMMSHILLYGNGYSEIDYNRIGEPVALWFIPAWRCKPMRTVKNELVYEVHLPDQSRKMIPSFKMLHIRGLSTDGISGLSVIKQAAESIGVSLAAQIFAGKFFSQGLNMGGIAEHPGKLSEAAYARLKKSLEDGNAGLSNAHKIMLLEEGLKFAKVGIPPEDAQFLETRQFQVVDIARMFGVPPHKIGDLSRATFSNIEHQAIEFVQDTMQPWFTNWEQEINRQLLGLGSDYYAEFLIEGLLRGDSQSRAEFYNKMFQMGVMSPNDIRDKENLNPVNHGDMYFIPLNLTPVDQFGQSKDEIVDVIEWDDCPLDVKEARKKKEIRASTMTRLRVANSYRSVFDAAGRRIVEREVKNVRTQIKKQLAERSVAAFKEWLEDYYRDFQKYIKSQIKPAALALGAAIAQLAAEEVKAEKSDTDTFIDDYAGTFAYRYAQSSKGQLLKILEADDYEEALETRLTEWELRRPEKVSMNETVQLSNAVAKIVFASAGITYLIWRNTGGKSCPYCEEMDGRRVGIDQDFLKSSDALKSEDGTMKIYRPSAHPPLHAGCVCQIEPE